MDHISYTQLSMVLRCGEQYYRRYLKGEILPPSGSLIRGRSCHKAEEMNFRQKINSLNDLAIEEIKDFFSDQWEESKFEIAWTPEELNGESPKKAEAKYKDSGISLITAYHTEIAPQTQPIDVEKKFVVKFKGGYPDLQGIIDRIDTNGIVIDLKFQAKSPTSDDIAKDIQMTAYDLGFRHTFGYKPAKLKKEYSIATKTAKTIIQETLPRDDETLTRFLYRLEKAMEVVEKGVFQPAPIGAWWCDPRYCGYYQTCRFHP